MTRRGWLLAIGAVLAAGQAVGCNRNVVAQNPPRPVVHETQNPTRPESPYALLPAPSPHLPPPASAPQIAPVHYPEPTAQVVARTPPGELHISAAAAVPIVRPEPPSPADPPVVVALRCLLKNQADPDRAMEALKAYDKATQDLLLVLLPLTASAATGSFHTGNAQEIGHLLDQLANLEDALRPRAPLAITTMCFCRGIPSFGAYDPIARDHGYRAGIPGEPLDFFHVYAELRNLTIRQNGEFFEISLKSRMVVRDADGRVVYETTNPEKHRYRSPRRDFFLSGRYEIDPKMAPGGYTMTVEVEDLFSQPPRPPACQSLDFQVIAGSMASFPSRR